MPYEATIETVCLLTSLSLGYVSDPDGRYELFDAVVMRLAGRTLVTLDGGYRAQMQRLYGELYGQKNKQHNSYFEIKEVMHRVLYACAFFVRCCRELGIPESAWPTELQFKKPRKDVLSGLVLPFETAADGGLRFGGLQMIKAASTLASVTKNPWEHKIKFWGEDVAVVAFLLPQAQLEFLKRFADTVDDGSGLCCWLQLAADVRFNVSGTPRTTESAFDSTLRSMLDCSHRPVMETLTTLWNADDMTMGRLIAATAPTPSARDNHVNRSRVICGANSLYFLLVNRVGTLNATANIKLKPDKVDGVEYYRGFNPEGILGPLDALTKNPKLEATAWLKRSTPHREAMTRFYRIDGPISGATTLGRDDDQPTDKRIPPRERKRVEPATTTLKRRKTVAEDSNEPPEDAGADLDIYLGTRIQPVCVWTSFVHRLRSVEQ